MFLWLFSHFNVLLTRGSLLLHSLPHNGCTSDTLVSRTAVAPMDLERPLTSLHELHKMLRFVRLLSGPLPTPAMHEPVCTAGHSRQCCRAAASPSSLSSACYTPVRSPCHVPHHPSRPPCAPLLSLLSTFAFPFASLHLLQCLTHIQGLRSVPRPQSRHTHLSSH